ncbi:MAG: MarR family transcriptional regulator [Verrucomicrobia bacterium]|nr:MarR family transcriptional regulator [Verrucomicrobiota bacterium]
MRDMLEIAQDEFVMRDRILDILKEEPKTILELSGILGCPSREVTIWLFGLRRYGEVEETGRADVDGYFKYEFVEKQEEEEESHA